MKRNSLIYLISTAGSDGSDYFDNFKMFYLKEYITKIEKELPILEFRELFLDPDKCLDFIFYKKFNGEECKCGENIIKFYRRVKSNGRYRRAYQCTKCSNQIYPTKDSIFEKSVLPLNDLFFILYTTTCISKKNTSALQLSKNYNYHYTTTHSFLKRMRYRLKQDFDRKLDGIVEVDEAFLGRWKNRWSRWGTLSTRLQPLLGMIERGNEGKVYVVLIENREAVTLEDVLLKYIEKGTTVFTDGFSGYNNLHKYFDHDWVNHSKGEYCREEVHTNNIENFWGIFKRTIRGAHQKVSGEYVQNYLDECVWKFNNRHLTSMQRFDDLIEKCIF